VLTRRIFQRWLRQPGDVELVSHPWTLPGFLLILSINKQVWPCCTSAQKYGKPSCISGRVGFHEQDRFIQKWGYVRGGYREYKNHVEFQFKYSWKMKYTMSSPPANDTATYLSDRKTMSFVSVNVNFRWQKKRILHYMLARVLLEVKITTVKYSGRRWRGEKRKCNGPNIYKRIRWSA